MKNTIDIEDIYQKVIEKISEIELKSIKDGRYFGWNYVRVYPDGDVFSGNSPSKCFPESEYFGKNPRPITIWESDDTGSFCLSLEDGGVEVCEVSEGELESVIKKIEIDYPDFREWEEKDKHDLIYKYSEKNFRPYPYSESGYGYYDESCGWVEIPDFDDDKKIWNDLESWINEMNEMNENEENEECDENGLDYDSEYTQEEEERRMRSLGINF